jgi:CRP-like cAMP-binding protein
VVAPTRLDTVGLFAPLSREERETLADSFDEVEVPAGERITSQGDFAYEFFAIEEGTARVEQDGEVIATLGPGDCFGEIGLIATGRRTAAVVAETPMRILAMFDQSFRRFDREMPAFADSVRARIRDCFSRPKAF